MQTFRLKDLDAEEYDELFKRRELRSSSSQCLALTPRGTNSPTRPDANKPREPWKRSGRYQLAEM